MNKNSNIYVILYASVMVILVAVGLAFTSQSLKERQTNNENIDQMRQILRSLRIDVEADQAMETYNSVIKEAYLVDGSGQVVAGSEGTDVEDPAFLASLPNLMSATAYPVYVAEVDGASKYVLGMYGAGLWGPIWGYLAINDDADTVYGIDFSHASETPGLGAEIAHEPFRKQFEGKHIYRDGSFKSIAVVKGGKADNSRDYVDGISGGTLTSHGVQNMLFESLSLYEPFLNNLKTNAQ